MRKFLVVMLVLTLALSVGISLVACSSDVDQPGTKWTNQETLSYEIYDGETLVGVLAVCTERLDVGTQTLNLTGETFNVDASTKGTRVTMKALFLDGSTFLESEAILNGFTTLASAKKITKNGQDTFIKARYDGKRYYYSVNDGEEEKVKIKTGFVDNELLYTVLRVYSIENDYTGSYTVMDNVAGEKTSLNISTSNADVRYTKGIKITSDGIAQADATNVKCVELNVQRSKAPIGTPIKVTYSVEGDGGLKVWGKGSLGLYSTHIPVQIVENNLTYKLVSIDCK